MSLPKQRITIDGIEFTEVFRFPRILGAVTASMQPPRLLVGLIAICVLMSAGRFWDSKLARPAVPPGGLRAVWTPEQDAEAQAHMRQVLLEHVDVAIWPDRDPAAWPRLDATDVLRRMERNYRVWRERAVELATFEEEEAAYFDLMASVDAVRTKGAFETAASEATHALREIVLATATLAPARFVAAVGNLVIDLPAGLWRHQRSFVIAYGLLAILVVAVGGGAVSRMAACQTALHERMRVFEAFEFAFGNWVRLVLALVLPILVATAVALVPIVLGLLMTLPFLDVVGGLLYAVALVAGFFLGFLALGYAAGFGLLIPAVACERCDPFDAMQRAYAYVMQRPLHLLGYAITALVGLVLGFFVVGILVVLTLNLTAGLVGLLNSHPAVNVAGGVDLFDMSRLDTLRIYDRKSAIATGWLISFWQTAVKSVLAAYVFVYLSSAATQIYLLLRRACDGQDVEEIWRPGLIPGTLAPLPQTTIVEEAGEPDADSS